MARKKRTERLVPLNIMVSPEQLEWIKKMTYGSGDSMARVVRGLIAANMKLHDVISSTTKGEK
jgi:hypothetical protein